MKIERVGPFLWRIPPDARPGMRVPALVVADDALMTAIRTDASLEQIANGATLPGIVKAALAMPDIHQGYGLPVGGVVATDAEAGVVSPGAIGFDINCGVRLLRTGLAGSRRDAADARAGGRALRRDPDRRRRSIDGLAVGARAGGGPGAGGGVGRRAVATASTPISSESNRAGVCRVPGATRSPRERGSGAPPARLARLGQPLPRAAGRRRDPRRARGGRPAACGSARSRS